MNVYTASSWKNKYYETVVNDLKKAGHEVYDFRNTISSKTSYTAFNWDQIDVNWESWTTEQFINGLKHDLARRAFLFDHRGMLNSDVCVLILPCGKSAHLEAGFMKGNGKRTYILMFEKDRPELTYSIADGIFSTTKELLGELELLEVLWK
jgi:hypothetical protein